jgi:hypothetical protein
MTFPAALAASMRAKGWVAALVLALSAGCASLPWQTWQMDGVPCQIATTWQSRVMFTPDPTKNGAQTPGLAGRLYLFGPEISYPMTGDGALVIDLYDETKGQAVMLERWQFDAETLKRLLKKDMIGWGYTLFLPWGQYTPDITKIRLKARYEPPKRAPLFTENVVTLDEKNGVVHVSSSATPLHVGTK